jgi:hypothetical protein
MKKRFMISLSIFVVIVAACVTLWTMISMSYVQYVPITRGDLRSFDVYQESPELNTLSHQMAVATVLTQWGESYKFVDGKIFITRRLRSDIDLCMNLTSKAIDEEAEAKANKTLPD